MKFHINIKAIINQIKIKNQHLIKKKKLPLLKNKPIFLKNIQAPVIIKNCQNGV